MLVPSVLTTSRASLKENSTFRLTRKLAQKQKSSKSFFFQYVSWATFPKNNVAFVKHLPLSYISRNDIDILRRNNDLMRRISNINFLFGGVRNLIWNFIFRNLENLNHYFHHRKSNCQRDDEAMLNTPQYMKLISHV